MASSKATKNKYSSNATQKIPYIRIPTGTKIVKLFKKPLSIAYKKKKRVYYWLKSKKLTAYKELKKGKA